jgi:ribosome maturation factor RimP
MNHPLVSQLFDLAVPLADRLGLEVVDIVLQTNKRPPILRVDIRNRQAETGLDDCERMSRSLETLLDSQSLLLGAYVLEVSSPGISRQLTTDREFEVFRGFPVLVKTNESVRDHQRELRGSLRGRDASTLYLQQKGKAIAIPLDRVTSVQLAN